MLGPSQLCETTQSAAQAAQAAQSSSDDDVWLARLLFVPLPAPDTELDTA